MSYDVYLEAPRIVDVWSMNFTSNVSGMWFDALCRSIGRQPGREKYHDDLGAFGPLSGFGDEPAIRHLRRAADIIREDEEGAFSRRNPENRWGDHLSAAKFLDEIADAWEREPLARLRVSR